LRPYLKKPPSYKRAGVGAELKLQYCKEKNQKPKNKTKQNKTIPKATKRKKIMIRDK
jgi:hypothetical protein